MQFNRELFRIFFIRNGTYKHISTNFVMYADEVQSAGACSSERMQNLASKLRQKTPIGKLEELEEGKHPHQEKEPLPAFPHNTNPTTGEIGGPRGPEPTRYGDWERKGRVTDF